MASAPRQANRLRCRGAPVLTVLLRPSASEIRIRQPLGVRQRPAALVTVHTAFRVLDADGRHLGEVESLDVEPAVALQKQFTPTLFGHRRVEIRRLTGGERWQADTGASPEWVENRNAVGSAAGFGENELRLESAGDRVRRGERGELPLRSQLVHLV